MVANQAMVFAQIIEYYLGPGKEHLPEINRLAKLNTDAADDVLLHYVMEGIRKSTCLLRFKDADTMQDLMELLEHTALVIRISLSMMVTRRQHSNQEMKYLSALYVFVSHLHSICVDVVFFPISFIPPFQHPMSYPLPS